MTVEEIAAKVIEVLKMDGCFDALPMALDDCEERGASRETIIAALGLAVLPLRDDAKASLHLADALLGYSIDYRIAPMHADHHLRADERELEADTIEMRMRATRRQEQKATVGLAKGGQPRQKKNKSTRSAKN